MDLINASDWASCKICLDQLCSVSWWRFPCDVTLHIFQIWPHFSPKTHISPAKNWIKPFSTLPYTVFSTSPERLMLFTQQNSTFLRVTHSKVKKKKFLRKNGGWRRKERKNFQIRNRQTLTCYLILKAWCLRLVSFIACKQVNYTVFIAFFSVKLASFLGVSTVFSLDHTWSRTFLREGLYMIETSCRNVARS